MTEPFFVTVVVPENDQPIVRVGPVMHLAEAYQRWPFLPQRVVLVDMNGERRVMEKPPERSRGAVSSEQPMTAGQKAWRDRKRQQSRSEHLRKHWTGKHDKQKDKDEQ